MNVSFIVNNFTDVNDNKTGLDLVRRGYLKELFQGTEGTIEIGGRDHCNREKTLITALQASQGLGKRGFLYGEE